MGVGSGRTSKETKEMQQAFERMQEYMGKAKEEMDIPIESIDDLMREAQSVLNYFAAAGDGFIEEICKTCGKTFVYCWNVKAVKYCSIPCMSEALKAIGLRWHPGRKPVDRWGQYIPAIVPPQVLELVGEFSDTPEDSVDDIFHVLEQSTEDQ